VPKEPPAASDSLRAFIARWAPAQASERSNYQSFLKELCAVFGAPEPEPAVLGAYGWDDLDAESPAFAPAVLERLVALNLERRAEEESGLVRWLRPEFQARDRAGAQTSLAVPLVPTAAPSAAEPEPWPVGVPARVRAIRRVLREAGGPADAGAVAARFAGARPAEVADLLEVIVELGQGRRTEAGAFTV